MMIASTMAVTDTNDWMLGIVAVLIVAMIVGGVVLYGDVRAMKVTLDRLERDLSEILKLERRITRIEDHLEMDSNCDKENCPR